MAENYLTEDDFEFQSKNDALKDKAEQITSHTSLVLLDLSDEDIAVFDRVEEEFELLKEVLFLNSDKILQLDDDDTNADDLYGFQQKLFEQWDNIGLTEGFFHRMYQVKRGLINTNLSANQLERLELLNTILDEQAKLIMAFNVAYSKEPQVILDIGDYM